MTLPSTLTTEGFDYINNELAITHVYEVNHEHTPDWEIDMIPELRRALRQPPLSEKRPKRWEWESLLVLSLYDGTPLSFALYGDRTKIYDSSGRCWAINYSKK